MTTLVLWVPLTVLRTDRLLPMLIRDGLISWDFAEYVASPARCSRSPSLLTAHAAAARALSNACLPARGNGGDAWGWIPGIERLYHERSRSEDAARVLRNARSFIAYLAANCVPPNVGSGWIASRPRAPKRLGMPRQQSTGGLLAYIVPVAGPVSEAARTLHGWGTRK